MGITVGDLVERTCDHGSIVLPRYKGRVKGYRFIVKSFANSMTVVEDYEPVIYHALSKLKKITLEEPQWE
jgi:hypothetical protein